MFVWVKPVEWFQKIVGREMTKPFIVKVNCLRKQKINLINIKATCSFDQNGLWVVSIYLRSPYAHNWFSLIFPFCRDNWIAVVEMLVQRCSTFNLLRASWEFKKNWGPIIYCNFHFTFRKIIHKLKKNWCIVDPFSFNLMEIHF